MNISLAKQVIQKVYEQGVREFCLCAGARNSPLVCVLEQTSGVRLYNFFEERSAAFFALGRIQATDSPVAVVTTSGTAAAELLPAAVEATYTTLPLVLITADRPQSYRGTGAPQTIEQVGIYSHYVEESYDLTNPKQKWTLESWSKKKPVHLNLCFSEPLLDEALGPYDLVTSEMQRIEKILSGIRDQQSEYLKKLLNEDEVVEESDFKILRNFLKDNKRPLVIAGGLTPRRLSLVENFLEKLNCPIYAEALSGLRSCKNLQHLFLKSTDQIATRLFDQGRCDSVIRIGGVPTLRFWRDLEEKFMQVPLLSISDSGYTGVARDSKLMSMSVLKSEKIADICQLEAASTVIYDVDQKLNLEKENLLRKYPRSEPGLVYSLAKKIKPEASLYLGNSLPIREWDLVAPFERHPKRVLGNRGANGIDGQLSTFLGWSQIKSENWAIVGDLTALYDLTSLWATPQLEKAQRRIVVINNSGGRIFDRMFKKDIFINQHEIQFKNWAEMWNWDYQEWKTIPDIFPSSEKQVIEITPDPEQTKLFWNEFESLWKKT